MKKNMETKQVLVEVYQVLLAIDDVHVVVVVLLLTTCWWYCCYYHSYLLYITVEQEGVFGGWLMCLVSDVTSVVIVACAIFFV